MDTLGPANIGIILLLYRDCPLSEVKLYCYGPVGTTELVLYKEIKCTVSFIFKRSSNLVIAMTI